MKESLLSKEYWRAALGELKRLRTLTFAALICGLGVELSGLYVAVGENLRVYFTFFITAVGCSVYGPVMGLLVAAAGDTLGYLMFPTGAYFPGYLISEMVGALIYSLFLYRRKITVLRLYGAKFCVNYLVNVGLGCLWSKMLYGQGYLYYLFKSLVKNTLLLPLEVICLSALFSLVIPVFSRFHLLAIHDGADLDRLKLSKAVFPVLGISCVLAGLCCGYYWYVTDKTLFFVLGLILLALAVAFCLLGRIRDRKEPAGHSKDT